MVIIFLLNGRAAIDLVCGECADDAHRHNIITTNGENQSRILREDYAKCVQCVAAQHEISSDR